VRLLADESVDMAVMQALRADGHDVFSVAESRPGALDEEVIDLARAERRVLLTEDRDFGRLIFASLQSVGGVMYLRYPSNLRFQMANQIVELLRERSDTLQGAFVVVQPGRTRISRLPDT
jgi:predicted nuclease of predicted toxin-antitoxin system